MPMPQEGKDEEIGQNRGIVGRPELIRSRFTGLYLSVNGMT